MNAHDIMLAEQAEYNEAKILVLIRQSPELQRLLAVWPTLPKKTDKLFETDARAPEETEARWRWLWSLIEYNSVEWLKLALLPNNSYGKSLIDRAITLRLVFPDGSLHDWVNRYLEVSAVGMFAGVQGKGRKKKPPRAPEEEKEEQGEGVEVTKMGDN